MTAKAILKKLGDELGHISLIADWIKKEAALLGEEVEEVFCGKVHSDTQGAFAQHASAGLTGAGAADAPEPTPAPTDAPPEVAPSQGQADQSGEPVPAADNGLPPASAGEDLGDGATAQTATTATSAEAPAAAPTDAQTGL